MNPYMITMIVFGVVLGVVWLIVGKPSTVYLPTVEGVQEDVETRKKRAQKVRSRRFVFGIGGTFGLCLLTMLGIWLSGPVTTVYGAFHPSATPTITSTATSTPTRLPTRTQSITPTSKMLGTLSAMSTLTAQTSQPGNGTPTFKPSGNTPVVPIRVYSTVVVINTRIVTKVVYVTVVVTATPIPSIVGTVTPSETPTATFTPTETPTSTPTAMCETVLDGTPVPCTETPIFTPTETPIP
jgi:hypothetical protein